MKAIAAAVLLLASSGAWAGNPVEVYGIGMMDCRTLWRELGKTPDGWAVLGLYISGYVSGVNSASGLDDIASKTSIAKISANVLKFCRENPGAGANDAIGDALIEAMNKK